MKIHISIPTKTARWFWNISNLISNSLRDCGHEICDIEVSELVIAIQQLQSNQKISGKKYILLSTEQKNHPTTDLKKYYSFGPDIIWGFDIENKDEEYICLGYHPCLEDDTEYKKDINVSFFGCMTPRRKNLLDSVKHKFIKTSTWNFNDKIRSIKRSQINLNIHSYCQTNYTEWDRICLMLANKSFLLSEEFYCPLKVATFKLESYDHEIGTWLNNENKRKEISYSLYEEYKKNFDMRNILTEKLRGIL